MNDKEELWKLIPGYEPYEASNLGNIRLPVKDRYTQLNKWKNGIYYRTNTPYHSDSSLPSKPLVHRLVALAWVPNPDNKSQINHKDGNGANNVSTNLEWVTGSENVKHALRTGLRSDNIAITITDITTDEVHKFLSLNTASKFLEMGIDTLVTYVARSKIYPIYNKYVIDVPETALERMFDTDNYQARTVYVYDHVDKKEYIYKSMAIAAINTGINTYTVRSKLRQGKINEYYIGSYTFSYNKKYTLKDITTEQAKEDRDKIWSKPVTKVLPGFELYNYGTKEITTLKNRNDVAKLLGCKASAVTGAINRGDHKNRTWLLGGYGIRALGSKRDWYDYSMPERINSKYFQKFDTPIYRIGGKLYFGTKKVASMIGVSFDALTNAKSKGQHYINNLLSKYNIKQQVELVI